MELSNSRLEMVKLIIMGLLAVVLIAAMTWIILSPVSDDATKGALVIIGTAVGFIFGKETK